MGTIKHLLLTCRNILALAVLSVLSALPAKAQETFADTRPRLILGAEAGSQTSLGYKLPSAGFGTTAEVPVSKRFEFQSTETYSPDRKFITNDGQSLKFNGSAIGFINDRMGVSAGLEHNWLWTSQFNKRSWLPSAGIVLRNDYFGPGRLYVSYVFPTGCVWATPTNPCRIQSNRLQGIELRQEVRSGSRMRWGFKGGFYRFCDEGNPNDPQAGRNCHLALTALATLGFEFHLGTKSHFKVLDQTPEDNF